MRHLLLFVLLLSVSLAGQNSSSSDKPKDLYIRGLNALTGSVQSISVLTGVDLIRRSAELGYGPAQTSMGYIEETGISTTRVPQSAASWYKRAAESGDTLAAWSLGRLYFVSAIPERIDGEKWLQQAADKGDPFGAYLFAESVFPRDRATAAKYYREAAEQGLPFAQYRFGIALRDGLGIAVNKPAAYVWLLTSQQAGVQQAADAVQALEAELGSAGSEKGKTAARDLEDRVLRSRNAHGCTGWTGELDIIPSPPPLDTERFCR